MENKPDYYLENGVLVCRLYVGLDDERKSILKEHIDATKKAKETHDKLYSYLKTCKIDCLPPSKDLTSLKIENGNLIATYKFNGNYYVERKTEAPKIEPKPPNPNQLYIDLSNRYDFKQILGSGILTKNEKRKCLGLPEIEEQK
jgi:hypothetical protein